MHNLQAGQDADIQPQRTGAIKIHRPEHFEGMRKAGRLAAKTLDHIAQFVNPGVTTGELDVICREFVLDNGGFSAPLNYRGYPGSVCTSVNHVICHGIPGDKVLEDGDVLNIDVTTSVDGWHGDTSRMYTAGTPNRKAQRLCDVTYEAMMLGIAQIRPGATTGDIGHAIQSFAEGKRYSVVRDFCGHGIGQVFHDSPNILHYGEPGTGYPLAEGMFFTVEPMINLGKWHVRMKNDGWTAVTKDRSLSAQFEHSVAVTADGVEIFTESPTAMDKPPYGTD
jgi:methionyl aminopeptidase